MVEKKKKKKKKILVAECNVSGEWWAFEKLDSLINHFHWYYKDPVLFDQNSHKPTRSEIIAELTNNGEVELHSKKEHPKHKETYLFVRMVALT